MAVAVPRGRGRRCGTSASPGPPNGSATNRRGRQAGPIEVAAGQAGTGQVQLSRHTRAAPAAAARRARRRRVVRDRPADRRRCRATLSPAHQPVAYTVASVGPYTLSTGAPAAPPDRGHRRAPAAPRRRRRSCRSAVARLQRRAPAAMADGTQLTSARPVRHASGRPGHQVRHRPRSQPPDEQRGEDLEHRHVERDRGRPPGPGPAPPYRGSAAPMQPGPTTPRVLNDDALRLAGGAGGVDHVGGVAGRSGRRAGRHPARRRARASGLRRAPATRRRPRA